MNQTFEKIVVLVLRLVTAWVIDLSAFR